MSVLRMELEELRKSRDELRLKLRKKEWECESRTMERDQQQANVEKLRLKMNRKTTELSEAWQHEQELQDKMQLLKQQVCEEEGEGGNGRRGEGGGRSDIMYAEGWRMYVGRGREGREGKEGGRGRSGS